jgi:AcrR family transcriptional regulator
MNGLERAQKWVAAGLAELAETGLDGVRVEVLARRLGVTKGGFYRQFSDRPALLNAMLDTWAEGRIAAIHEQTDLAGESAGDRLRSIIQLFAERANVQGTAIELAIRQWARFDAAAAAAAARVDHARLDRVCELYRMQGYEGGEANARAVLFYTFIYGRGLLHLELPAAAQAALADACAEVLTAPPTARDN